MTTAELEDYQNLLLWLGSLSDEEIEELFTAYMAEKKVEAQP